MVFGVEEEEKSWEGEGVQKAFHTFNIVPFP